ncbi:SGNH/GDSL hydrolase family protein [Corynebacterium sp. MNWGS58]|uniref:SGNH/GDSL hydrolase family protein n=1 Tax=Corynebacterium sp. 102791.4 TaxID=3104612 RepID=UPI0035123AE8
MVKRVARGAARTTLWRTHRRALGAVLAISALVISSCTSEPAMGPADDSGAPTPPTSEQQASEQQPGEAVDSQASTSTAAAITTYVALGDSFASMGSREDGGAGDDDARGAEAAFCRRSQDNYPRALSELLNVESVVDRSCQGAIIDNLSGQRAAGDIEIPAQMQAFGEVDAPVDLVTLTIGGNDIGFGEMVWCAQNAMQTHEPSNCSAYLDRKVAHETKVVEDRLDQVFQEIRTRAPQARIVATGYLPLLGVADDCAEIAAISGTDRAWLQSVTHQLNQAAANAAQRRGAEFVLPAHVDKHTVCAEPEQRWVDLTGAETGSYPFHPTAAGQRAMAEAIRDQVQLG